MNTWVPGCTQGLTAGGSKHLLDNRPTWPLKAAQLRLWEPTFPYFLPHSQPGRDKLPKAWPPHWPEYLAPGKYNVSSISTQIPVLQACQSDW